MPFMLNHIVHSQLLRIRQNHLANSALERHRLESHTHFVIIPIFVSHHSIHPQKSFLNLQLLTAPMIINPSVLTEDEPLFPHLGSYDL